MVAHALAAYDAGDSCAQCLPRAAAAVYGFSLSPAELSALNVLSGGLGIGGLCAVALSALLCLGLLCDEATARQLRLCFLCRFQAEQGCLHCAGLSRGDCRSLIAAGAALTQELLESVGCQPAASR